MNFALKIGEKNWKWQRAFLYFFKSLTSPFAEKVKKIIYKVRIYFFYNIFNFFILEKVSKYECGEGSVPYYHKFVANQYRA